MKNRVDSYYPVFLDISGKKCVVIGGGQIAWRKVTSLLEKGAEVEVISPVFCQEIDQLLAAGKITAQKKVYQNGDLNGAKLAIAATDDPETNAGVTREGREKSILVNVVDDAAKSDFILPSCLQRGDLTIAVSTAGKSPALARKIRTRLETQFGEEYALLARVINEVRTDLKNEGLRFSSEQWQEALDLDSMLALLKEGKPERAKKLLVDNLKMGTLH